MNKDDKKTEDVVTETPVVETVTEPEKTLEEWGKALEAGEHIPEEILNQLLEEPTQVIEPEPEPEPEPVSQEPQESLDEIIDRKVRERLEAMNGNPLDNEISSTGLEMEESFSVADAKWAKIYDHFQGDSVALNKVIEDPSTLPEGLEAPKEFDKYLKVARAYQTWQQMGKPANGLQHALALVGIETTPKVPKTVSTSDAQKRLESEHLAALNQQPGLLPAGQGNTTLDSSDSAMESIVQKKLKLGQELDKSEKEWLYNALDRDIGL